MEITCAGDMGFMPGDDHEPMFTEEDEDLEVVEAGDRSALYSAVKENPEYANERKLRSATAKADQNVTPEPDLFDPWAALDPHAANQTPKPLRVGRVTKYPPSILETRTRAKEGNKDGPDRVPVIVPIDQFLAAEMTTNMKRFPRMQPEFYDLALKEYERRKDHRAHQKKNKRKNQQTAQQLPAEKEDHDEENDNFSDIIENEDFDDADCVCPEIDEEELEDLPDPHLGGDVGAIVMDADYKPP